jgi:hypothetical protein
MIKQLRSIALFIILFSSFSTLKGVNEKFTSGGWVSVKRLDNSKFEITCNLLYTVSGKKNNMGIPSHQELTKGDTSVSLRVYDSTGSYIKLFPQLIRGYYYSQKDTNNTQISPTTTGVFFLNKYYLFCRI